MIQSAYRSLICDTETEKNSLPTQPNGTSVIVKSSNIIYIVSSGVLTVIGRMGTPNYYQIQTSISATTASLTYVMAGLAIPFTPKTSGILMIIISGDASNTVGADGASFKICYGTTTTPNNGDAVTGIQAGTPFTFDRFIAASKNLPFSTQAVVSGLTLNTTYWIDLAYEAITGGSVGATNISVSIFEL